MIVRHKITGVIIFNGTDLRYADLRYANLRGANLRGVDLYGADLRGADLYGADLRGTTLTHCKGILSFTGGKHLIVYFKYNGVHYAKIGCMTKPIQEWLVEFDEVGTKECYDVETIKLYGEVLKVFLGFELL